MTDSTSQTEGNSTTRFWLAVTFVIILAQVVSQYLMGRLWICECGYVKLFEAGVNTPGNSQHLFDWYTPSHIIHGFLFYGLGWLVMRDKPITAKLALAALIEAGSVPTEELETYGSDDRRLPMSGMASYTPGMEMSGGSLGQGLTIAVGRALGLKRKQSSSRVFTLFSDGELDEGSVWEAALSAAHYKLDNLIAIVDINNQQADGPSGQVLSFEPLTEKFQSFGWFTQRINGNDLAAVEKAFDAAMNHPEACPRMIIADTKMGFGVPFLEAREKNHFIRVDADEWQKALEALEAWRVS